MNNMKKEQKEQVFKKKEPIYLDANCFIYASIDKTHIGQKAKEILTQIKNGIYKKAYTSTLTVDEFLWRVQKEVGRDLASEGASIFLTIPNLELVNVDTSIISETIELYKNQRLDPRDSIHLASMKSKKIKTIISSDPDFDKVDDIKRLDFTKKL